MNKPAQKTAPPQYKEAIGSVLLLTQSLMTAIERLPPEARFKAPEFLQEFQRKLMPLIPPQTQQWVTKEVQKDAFEALPVAIRNHVRASTGTPGNMYERLNSLMEYLTHHKRLVGRKIQEEKYTLLMDFIEKEVTADITGGISALEAVGESLTFRMATAFPGPLKIEHP